MKFIIHILKSLKSKFYFKPSRKNILIYDQNGEKYINTYLNKETYEILHTRKEKFSLLIILICMVKLKFSLTEYIEEFIKYARPKIIITFIDNNFNYYKLKINNNIKKIFIQNGLRTAYNDIFYYTHDKDLNIKNHLKNEKFNVDYMLVWNNDIARLYKDFIHGKCLTIGSFQNNITKKKNNINNKKILFISNYKKDYNINYIKNEKKFLLNLRNYCLKNKIELDILGKNIIFFKEEKHYFSQILASSHFGFIPASNNRKTYELTSKYKIIVTIESSLGYEMLSRNKKVAFFNTHENIYPINTLYFGWPKKKLISGPFWTNKFHITEIRRILDYLLKINDQEWNKVIRLYSKNTINFDENNKEFVHILKKEGMYNFNSLT
jgi:surface carbohydrate biosynthesis protein